LTAQRGLLASQTTLNASATNTALAVVELYKSLGGGWNPAAFGAASQAGEAGAAQGGAAHSIATPSPSNSPSQANP